MIDKYGHKRILDGLIHFLIGKALSAVGGFLAIVLVARSLTVQDFAAYSILIALVEIFTAFTGLGIVHAILRYVPELYSKAYYHSLHALVRNAVLIRTAILVLACVVTYALTSYITPQIGLLGYEEVFKLFLIIVVLRTTTFFVSQILESTLHQRAVQIAFTLGTYIRLVGMLLITSELYFFDNALKAVICLEVLSEMIILVVMSRSLYQVITDDRNTEIDSMDQQWIPNNMQNMMRFALNGYLQHVAITPYGGNTNRLVGGALLTVREMAAFGFAQSVYEYIKRYLPAQLLVGLIRPVIVARYAKHLDFSIPVRMCSQIMQINIVLIGLIVVLVVVGGDEAVMAITAGKYGHHHGLYILLGLLVVLILETQRQQLELLAQTVERYEYLIFSNLFLAFSVFPAVWLITKFEAIAFPIANGVGLVIANYWVQFRLEKIGYFFNHDWPHTLRIILIGAISTTLGLLIKQVSSYWILGILFAGVLYGVLVYWFMFETFTKFLSELRQE